MMPWLLLIIAGLLETCWAVGLKYTEGFTRLIPSIFVGLSAEPVTLARSLCLLLLLAALAGLKLTTP